jgi:putative ABC transport system substrate-binding protein
LNQAGYVEGRNFVIEYRWAGNQADRLPALAADLVRLQVSVIVAAGSPSALAEFPALALALPVFLEIFEGGTQDSADPPAGKGTVMVMRVG